MTQEKPWAIASLEDRLALALDTVCAYGIVQKYLPSTLMWSTISDQRPHGPRAPYPADEGIPSWSWMAYDGPIEYFSGASREIEVSPMVSRAFRDFFSTWVLTKQMKRSHIIELTVPAKRLVVHDGWDSDVMSGFRFDEIYDGSPNALLCVPIAKEKQGFVQNDRPYWVILIERIPGIDDIVYRRVGVGSLAEEEMSADTMYVRLR